MQNSREQTALITSHEPPDGAVLVVCHAGDWRVIWRDDRAAADPQTHPEDRWFSTGDDGTSDPMSLHEHLKYADQVYLLGAQIAAFR